MKLNLKTKITVMTILVAIVPLLAVYILTNNFEKQIVTQAQHELDILAQNNIKQIASDVYNMCQSTNEILMQKLKNDSKVANKMLKDFGGIKFSNEMVQWSAINQYNKDISEIKLPLMKIGDKWLGKNNDLAKKTYFIDDVVNLLGGTCTVFQRMNKDGDMLRIATNVKDSEGNRALGTYIPAINPDGTVNPVIKAIMKNTVYTGTAYVVNSWYLTQYTPISNDKGEVIAILYLGIKLNELKSLTKAISNISIGKSGYISVINAAGEKHR